MATTIHRSDKPKARLVRHKLHAREPYAEVVERALNVLEEEDFKRTQWFQEYVNRGRADVAAGRTLGTEELIGELGLWRGGSGGRAKPPTTSSAGRPRSNAASSRSSTGALATLRAPGVAVRQVPGAEVDPASPCVGGRPGVGGRDGVAGKG